MGKKLLSISITVILAIIIPLIFVALDLIDYYKNIPPKDFEEP